MADISELAVFNKKSTCKKCASDLITCEYNSHMDLIKKECSECGFEWFELPVDRAIQMGKIPTQEKPHV